MSKQNKLQKILNELLKEKGHDSGTMHIYCTVYTTDTTKQATKLAQSNATSGIEEFDDLSDMDMRLQLTATVTKDKADFSIEAPAMRAAPGKLSGKHMKHTVMLDKFGSDMMQVLNANDEE